jgi:DNA-binding transcriptional LysR family regulator
MIALEKEVGTPLFHRMGRGVRLTEAGRAFLPYVQRALEALDTGREALKGIRTATSGKLHIGSARVICAYVLPEILERFHRSYPGIEVSIKTGRSTEVLEMVLSEEVQVGLSRTLVHPQIDSFHLYDEYIVLVTHPHHPFARAGEASIFDVAQEPLILYDRGSTYFILIERFCREAGIAPRIEMELDSVEATKRMIERGLGVSFLPRNSIRWELAQKTLTEVKLKEGHQVKLPTSVMVRKADRQETIVSAFLDVLRQMFPKE